MINRAVRTVVALVETNNRETVPRRGLSTGNKQISQPVRSILEDTEYTYSILYVYVHCVRSKAQSNAMAVFDTQQGPF